MRHLRIGVDIRALARGTRSGVEEYVSQITRALVAGYPDVEWRLFYNARRRVPPPGEWLRRRNVRLIERGIPNRILDFTGAAFNVPKIDRLLGGVDLFFSPHFFWASLSRAPRVLTFHDLSFVRYPEFFPLQKRFWHFRLRLARQVRNARHLIAVSESTKRDLTAVWGVPPERITVIPEGVVPEEFYPIGRTNPKLLEFRRLHALPEKFILFLGTREPRKNVLGALEAFAWLRAKGKIPKDVHFVIAGNKGWLGGDVTRFISAEGLADMVRFSPVESEDRRFWYNAAFALVFPSFFEGFGLPPLEAMACGTPVVVSNRSSLPEVAGTAAIAVDPYRPEEIAEAMAQVLEDGELREEMRQRGIVRAREFSWATAAKRTFDVFEEVLHT